MKTLAKNDARTLNGGRTCKVCGTSITDNWKEFLWKAPLHVFSQHSLSDWLKVFC